MQFYSLLGISMGTQYAQTTHDNGYHITWLSPLTGALGADRDKPNITGASTRIVGIGNRVSRLVKLLHQNQSLRFDSYWRLECVFIDSLLPTNVSTAQASPCTCEGLATASMPPGLLSDNTDAVIYIIESESQLAESVINDQLLIPKNKPPIAIAILVGAEPIYDKFLTTLKYVDNIYHIQITPNDDTLIFLTEFIYTVIEPYTGHSFVCVDFSDVLCVLHQGESLLNTWKSSDSAFSAAKNALNDLSTRTRHSASGVLAVVTGGVSLSLGDFDKASELIQTAFNNAEIVVVALGGIDPDCADDFKVNILVSYGRRRYPNSAKPVRLVHHPSSVDPT